MQSNRLEQIRVEPNLVFVCSTMISAAGRTIRASIGSKIAVCFMSLQIEMILSEFGQAQNTLKFKRVIEQEEDAGYSLVPYILAHTMYSERNCLQ